MIKLGCLWPSNHSFVYILCPDITLDLAFVPDKSVPVEMTGYMIALLWPEGFVQKKTSFSITAIFRTGHLLKCSRGATAQLSNLLSTKILLIKLDFAGRKLENDLAGLGPRAEKEEGSSGTGLSRVNRPPRLRGRPRDEGPMNSSPLSRSLRQPLRGKEHTWERRCALQPSASSPALTNTPHPLLPPTISPQPPTLPPPQAKRPRKPPLQTKEREPQRLLIPSFNTSKSMWLLPLRSFWCCCSWKLSFPLHPLSFPQWGFQVLPSSLSVKEGQRWRQHSVTAGGEGALVGLQCRRTQRKGSHSSRQQRAHTTNSPHSWLLPQNTWALPGDESHLGVLPQLQRPARGNCDPRSTLTSCDRVGSKDLPKITWRRM